MRFTRGGCSDGQHPMSGLSRTEASGSLARIWREVRPRRGRGALALLLSCLAMACAIGLIAASGWLISRASQQPPMFVLGLAIVAVRACGVGRGVFRYAERLVAHSSALAGLANLRASIVARLAITAPSGTRAIRHGDALRRMVDDVDATAEFGLRTVLPGTTAVIVGALTVGLLSLLAPLAGLILLAGLLIGGVAAPFVTARAGQQRSREEAALKGELDSRISAHLDGLAELTASGADAASLDALLAVERRACELELQSARKLGLGAAVAVAAQGLALVGIVCVAIPAVSAGSLAGVDLAVAVLLPLAVFELVTGLPGAAAALLKARSSSERIAELLDQPDPVPDPQQAKPLPQGPASADVRARSLSVTWPGSHVPAVTGIDLDLSAGQRVALVGPSGAGKSTIAAALADFVRAEGDLTLGGVDYRELNGDEIRSRVGLCTQDAHIFDNTIAENVRLAKSGASDAEVSAALSTAGLGDFISSLDRGIHTQVGQRGAQLSGGQRQRLSLARIVLADTPVVILDEPLEHLDAVAADALLTDILDITADRSLLMITHTRAHLTTFDTIIDLT